MQRSIDNFYAIKFRWRDSRGIPLDWSQTLPPIGSCIKPHLLHNQKLPGLERHRNVSPAPLQSRSVFSGLFPVYQVKTDLKRQQHGTVAEVRSKQLRCTAWRTFEKKTSTVSSKRGQLVVRSMSIPKVLILKNCNWLKRYQYIFFSEFGIITFYKKKP